jgi:signal transduction histidine kinase
MMNDAMRRIGTPLVLASAIVALGLVGVVWLDYVSTRRELVGLLREHALALRETVAAAARSNRAAGALAETQIAERLRDQARALLRLDREGALTRDAVEEVTRRDPLFRVSVLRADGTRDPLDAPSSVEGGAGLGGPGGGPGWRGGRRGDEGRGGGSGRGLGEGRGHGPGGVAWQILKEKRDEVVTGLHASRWGQGGRMAAGLRRPGGGAIVVNVDASAVGRLQEPASLETLLEEVTDASPEIAYTEFAHEGGRLAFGDVPEEGLEDTSTLEERERLVNGRPILEFTRQVPLAEGEVATLRLGMRLDGVHRVEQRMVLRLLAALLAAGALVALAFGLTGLRRRYGVLSERHARAEEALKRRDRLVAMGELASTVAHEIRNPLNSVGLTAQRLRREFLGSLPPGEADRAEVEDLLGVMAGETKRIDRIVQQFLDYARPPRLRLEPTDLGTLVRDVGESLRAQAEARGVRLEIDTAATASASVDPAQLRQALENLVRNAVDATPEGGEVAVGVRSGRGGHSIEVRDTGRGIDPEHLSKIFDLYFTTKPEGTGVGLAVTQQIVTAHGGTLEVESAAGSGTTMTIRLPREEVGLRG